eukprot:132933-Prorocentrum_minimum.AAC.1
MLHPSSTPEQRTRAAHPMLHPMLHPSGTPEQCTRAAHPSGAPERHTRRYPNPRPEPAGDEAVGVNDHNHAIQDPPGPDPARIPGAPPAGPGNYLDPL